MKPIPKAELSLRVYREPDRISIHINCVTADAVAFIRSENAMLNLTDFTRETGYAGAFIAHIDPSLYDADEVIAYLKSMGESTASSSRNRVYQALEGALDSGMTRADIQAVLDGLTGGES